jgi:O-antigen ligase
VVISKRNLINNLFLLSFPFYGIGVWRAYRTTFALGLMISILPFLLILLVHAVDLLYNRKAQSMVTRKYWVGLFFLLSLAGSYWQAFMDKFPGMILVNAIGYSVLYLVPYHAAIVVQIRNRDNDDFNFGLMLLKSMLLLVFVNFAGAAIGYQNVVHRFEGRLNLPFLMGIYDAAHLLSIINLMLLFYLKDFVKKPKTFFFTLLLYLANVAIMINVNSRLSFLMFLMITGLFVFRIMKTAKFVFPISLFTMPLLVNFALLIYTIMTLPPLSALVTRLDKEDVTSFNNRTPVWENGLDWFLEDRRGLLFGMGYQGQAKLAGWDRVGKIFMVRNSYDVHFHSTFLQTLTNQGIVGYLLLVWCYWLVYSYYQKKYKSDLLEAPIFAAAVYLIFIWQIDIVCYGMDFGNQLVMCLLSMAVMDPRFITRKQKMLDGSVALG